jgi:hypothetical protein
MSALTEPISQGLNHRLPSRQEVALSGRRTWSMDTRQPQHAGNELREKKLELFEELSRLASCVRVNSSAVRSRNFDEVPNSRCV